MRFRKRGLPCSHLCLRNRWPAQMPSYHRRVRQGGSREIPKKVKNRQCSRFQPILLRWLHSCLKPSVLSAILSVHGVELLISKRPNRHICPPEPSPVLTPQQLLGRLCH